MQTTDNFKLYTVNQVAEILGVHPGSVYRYICQGKISVKKPGGNSVRITEEELTRFIDEGTKPRKSSK